jgi:hypothetical protein
MNILGKQRGSFILSFIKYNIIFTGITSDTLCQQPYEAIMHTIIFRTALFDLTFRDYCGIKLLLGHKYGSHYLYLNLKNRL